MLGTRLGPLDPILQIQSQSQHSPTPTTTVSCRRFLLAFYACSGLGLGALASPFDELEAAALSPVSTPSWLKLCVNESSPPCRGSSPAGAAGDNSVLGLMYDLLPLFFSSAAVGCSDEGRTGGEKGAKVDSGDDGSAVCD